MITVDDDAKGVELVRSRQADAFFAERVLLLEKAGRGAKDLVVLERKFNVEPMGLAMGRNDDDFRLLVDTALSQLFTSTAFPALVHAVLRRVRRRHAGGLPRLLAALSAGLARRSHRIAVTEFTMSAQPPIHSRVLCIDGDLAAQNTAGSRRIRAIVDALRQRGVEVVESLSYEDGAGDRGLGRRHPLRARRLDPGRQRRAAPRGQATELLRALRKRNARVPVFLLADRKVAGHGHHRGGHPGRRVRLDPRGHAGLHRRPRRSPRSSATSQTLLPPFARALADYNREREYSWAAPGHQGGVAFLKSPVGRIFFDFYGENLFRTDMGIERARSARCSRTPGPSARASGTPRGCSAPTAATRCLNGTSGSNRTIMSACVGDDEIALCDRNCHKSIEQGLVITGGIPVFLQADAQPLRHHRPDPARATRAEGRSRKASRRTRWPRPRRAGAPVYAVLTNCTYDGMCYDAAGAQDRWRKASTASTSTRPGTATRASTRCTATATRCAAIPPSHDADGPTVFATHSTHKLLAALSQTSFIHVRDGRGAIDHGRFNEAYCSQASTSPLYALIASNEVAAAMMDGPAGEALTQDVIDEAVACRQAVARVRQEFLAQDRTGSSRRGTPRRSPTRRPASAIAFHDAPPELLASEPACWVLHPGESWHGFEGIPDGWCMLDPIKFGDRLPGHARRRHSWPSTASRATWSPRTSAGTASCRRAPPTTWSSSSSRSASPRASGAR